MESSEAVLFGSPNPSEFTWVHGKDFAETLRSLREEDVNNAAIKVGLEFSYNLLSDISYTILQSGNPY